MNATTNMLPALLNANFDHRDSRCRYWCKAWNIDQTPAPDTITGANALPGGYLRGDQTWEPGTVIATGEQRHHRKQRGWDIRALVVVPVESKKREGEYALQNLPTGAAVKKIIGLRYRDLLAGSGEHAAICRSAQYITRRMAEGADLLVALAELTV